MTAGHDFRLRRATPPDEPLSIPAPSLKHVIEACEVGLLATIAVGIAEGLIVVAA